MIQKTQNGDESNGQPEHPIPPALFKDISEFSNGGFVLISFTEDGETCTCMKAETSKDLLALVTATRFFVERQEDFLSERMGASVSSEED